MEEFCSFNKIYTSAQEKSIAAEFTRLQGTHYLEHAGATLYSEKQIENVASLLTKNLYANPHARNFSSKTTDDAIDIIRFQLLSHFNTDPTEYSIIFTSGATAGLKLVGEYFSYADDNNNKGSLVYLQDNHTSVLGMREYTESTTCLRVEEANNYLSKNFIEPDLPVGGNSLYVYPAQSNFCGTKYPLQWINRVKQGFLNSFINQKSNWWVLLDAASFASTNCLDLSEYKPDFVTISFYKIFGYPTGLGALLIKNSSAEVLKKNYYGGGTVFMALSLEKVMIPRSILHEKFEDGTLPFLSILSIKEGLDTIKRHDLNFNLISQHTFSLAQYVYKTLLTFHHSNGNPVAILYHNTIFDNGYNQGGIVNFNLLRDTGEYIGYSEVLHFSNLYNIHLRTGCFCNPGACQQHLKLSSDDVKRHFDAGHVCGDQHDLVDNYPTGSVRISFGYMSTKEDADALLRMIQECFITKPLQRRFPKNWNTIQQQYQQIFPILENLTNDHGINKKLSITNNLIDLNSKEFKFVLSKIYLYPVKSCGACEVSKDWNMTSTGLQYDRQWMIVNSLGVGVTQKHNKKLCMIKPVIEKSILTLTYKDKRPIDIPLNIHKIADKQFYLCQSKVCGDNVQGWDCGDEVGQWLEEVLEVPGLRLLRQCDSTDNQSVARLSKTSDTHLSLSNKAQFLLINTASVQWLKDRIEDKTFNEAIETTIHRFRPNLVVDFDDPFDENNYDGFTINGIGFKVTGKCTRCQMICINQITGEVSKEPLKTLSKEFKGKIAFGIYLNQVGFQSDQKLRLGDSVIGEIKSE